jgi:hypothetical protein
MVGRLSRSLAGAALVVVAALAPAQAAAVPSHAGGSEPIDVRLPRKVAVTEGASSVTINVTVVCDPGLDLVLGGTLSSKNLFGNGEQGYDYVSAVNRHLGFQCTGERQSVSMLFSTLDATTFTTSKGVSRKAALTVGVYEQHDDGVGQVLLYEAPTRTVRLKVHAA